MMWQPGSKGSGRGMGAAAGERLGGSRGVTPETSMAGLLAASSLLSITAALSQQDLFYKIQAQMKRY